MLFSAGIEHGDNRRCAALFGETTVSARFGYLSDCQVHANRISVTLGRGHGIASVTDTSHDNAALVPRVLPGVFVVCPGGLSEERQVVYPENEQGEDKVLIVGSVSASTSTSASSRLPAMPVVNIDGFLLVPPFRHSIF